MNKMSEYTDDDAYADDAETDCCNCGKEEKGCALMIVAAGLAICLIALGMGGCTYLVDKGHIQKQAIEMMEE